MTSQILELRINIALERGTTVILGVQASNLFEKSNTKVLFVCSQSRFGLFLPIRT